MRFVSSQLRAGNWEIHMQFHMKPDTAGYEINWRGIAGLAAMALGSTLGWVAIVAGFRTALR